jgi:hypothetical protein
MSEEHVIGHIGYSPDFKSKPEGPLRSVPGLLENAAMAPTLDEDGNIVSISLVKKGTGHPGSGILRYEMSAAEFAALKKKVALDVHDRLSEDLDRLRDLVWKNVEAIDFTGFEDILEQIKKARDG